MSTNSISDFGNRIAESPIALVDRALEVESTLAIVQQKLGCSSGQECAAADRLLANIAQLETRCRELGIS
jgi:hypothetical protein